MKIGQELTGTLREDQSTFDHIFLDLKIFQTNGGRGNRNTFYVQ